MSKRKEKRQELPVEFNDTVDAIIDKLKNPKDDLPEGFVIKYEIDNLEPPAYVSINKSWFEIPAKAPLQAQRFLKYVLSPNWQPM